MSVEPEVPKVKNKGGRPSSYTRELSDEVCLRMAQGETLVNICKSRHMPDVTTVTRWVFEDRDGFTLRYMRARAFQQHTIIDRLAEKSRQVNVMRETVIRQTDGPQGTTSTVETREFDNVARTKLEIDTEKWIAAKVAWRDYGDKLGLSDADGQERKITIIGGLPEDVKPEDGEAES